MSSLQDMSNFLLISMTLTGGQSGTTHSGNVSVLLHEAKPVLGLFCLRTQLVEVIM